MWCDFWDWASALQPHSHTHILTIPCTFYDVINGIQDLKICSHADSLILSLILSDSLSAPLCQLLFVSSCLSAPVCQHLSVQGLCIRWWLSADEPWQCLLSCRELATAMRNPEGPEAFLSRLPVHQDGSCNGLQHYAALGRDPVGAAQVCGKPPVI